MRNHEKGFSWDWKWEGKTPNSLTLNTIGGCVEMIFNSNNSEFDFSEVIEH
jgi:hypothetical protein